MVVLTLDTASLILFLYASLSSSGESFGPPTTTGRESNDGSACCQYNEVLRPNISARVLLTVSPNARTLGSNRCSIESISKVFRSSILYLSSPICSFRSSAWSGFACGFSFPVPAIAKGLLRSSVALINTAFSGCSNWGSTIWTFSSFCE